MVFQTTNQNFSCLTSLTSLAQAVAQAVAQSAALPPGPPWRWRRRRPRRPGPSRNSGRQGEAPGARWALEFVNQLENGFIMYVI